MPIVQRVNLYAHLDETVDHIRGLARILPLHYPEPRFRPSIGVGGLGGACFWAFALPNATDVQHFVNNAPILEHSPHTHLSWTRSNAAPVDFSHSLNIAVRTVGGSRQISVRLVKATKALETAVRLLHHIRSSTDNFENIFNYDSALKEAVSSVAELFLVSLLERAQEHRPLPTDERLRWSQLDFSACDAVFQAAVIESPHLSQWAHLVFAEDHIPSYAEVLSEDEDDESPFNAWLEPHVTRFLALFRHWFRPVVADHTVKRKRSGDHDRRDRARSPTSSSRSLTARSLAPNPYAPRARRNFALF
ncbi:hypothetical protein JCM10207_003901 [Rhodosporidiobolus poonsookiae]